MWEIDLNSQIQTFLLSLIIGMGFCVVFDIFNIFEDKMSFSKSALFMADIVLFVSFAIFNFCFLLVTENGEIRAYVFIGEIIGFLLCKKTLALVYIPIILVIIKMLKSLFCYVCRLFIRPLMTLFGKIGKKIIKIGQKRIKFIKKS